MGDLAQLARGRRSGDPHRPRRRGPCRLRADRRQLIAGPGWRWSMPTCSARPRRCSATGTCSRPCCGARSRPARGSYPSAIGEGAGRSLRRDREAMAGFERRLLVASRTAREDAVSRYLLADRRGIRDREADGNRRPARLAGRRLALVDDCRRRILLHPRMALGGAWRCSSFRPRSTWSRSGWRRCGCSRSARRCSSRRLLWPAAGLALIALGWFEARHGWGWGAMVAALGAAAFAEAGGSSGRAESYRRANGIFHAAPRSGWRCRSPSAAGGALYLGARRLLRRDQLFHRPAFIQARPSEREIDCALTPSVL